MPVSHVQIEMISTLLIGVSVVLLPLVLWNVVKLVYSFYRKWKAVKNITGYPTHWLWGNLHQIRVDEAFMSEFSNFVRKHKCRITRGWIGPFQVRIVLHHSDLVKKVLREPKDDDMYSLLKPWLGEGLLISQGKKWFRNRRLLTPAFHCKILKPYVDVYNSCLKIMLQKWTTSANMKEPVKVFETVKLLSLDIIMRCVFSFESSCQKEGAQKHPYLQAVCDLVELTAARYNGTSSQNRLDLLFFSQWPQVPKGLQNCSRLFRNGYQGTKKGIEISTECKPKKVFGLS